MTQSLSVTGLGLCGFSRGRCLSCMYSVADKERGGVKLRILELGFGIALCVVCRSEVDLVWFWHVLVEEDNY